MKKTGRIVLLCCLLISLKLFAKDSVSVFTQDEFLWYIENYHPVTVQGHLLLKKGKSVLRTSRGEFDPSIELGLNQKYFDDKNYYSILGTGLKIPTWYGIELKTGFDQNQGLFLNPDNHIPDAGLWYGGISVPLGQGLFIDKRRASLRQAKVFAQSTLAEQKKMMNDLYFDAIKEYWKWVENWNQYQIYEESVNLAISRFNAVKQSFLFGDVPAIDTLEAFIQVQNRQMNRNQLLLEYKNQTLELSNYLWFENLTPLVITDSLRPPHFHQIETKQTISLSSLEQKLLLLDQIHPEMQLYDYKLATLDIDKQIKIEQIKPKFNLNYNALNEPVGNSFTEGYSIENYKWGFEFKLPVFLRKERGELLMAKLKIQHTELDQKQKLLELKNKVKSYYNQQLILKDQLTLHTAAVNNYDLLLIGERKKFDSGESSLFLINSREINLIHARLKLIEIITKYCVTYSGLDWAMGELYKF